MIAVVDTLPIGSANREAYRRNALKAMRDVLRFARPRRVRPLLDFAEQELRYPTGRFRSQRFSRTYQPATSLLMAELSSDHWLQTFVVGPHQGGKSFSIIAWMLWCLFEKQEDVIFGLPDLGMRSAKWRKDILPMIQASAYKTMLPRSGAGSKGGVAEIIVFENGVSLQFMGAGGGDTQRAGATAKNLIVTEAEAFGIRGAGSEEASKWEQIQGRVAHFAGSERIIAESTVTVETALMWSNYSGGTASVVVCQCHSCREYVAPEREHLVGWQDAKTEEQARAAGRFSCPKCGILWSENDRLKNLQTAVLRHSGQTVTPDGEIVGPVPPTRKLGFRFSAATNMFADAGSIAVEEWTRARTENNQQRDNRDRALYQFRFALPVKPTIIEIDKLDGRVLLLRSMMPGMGIIPDDTVKLYGGVDVRKTQVHWTIVAFRESAGPHVTAWGVETVDSSLMVEEGLRLACTKLQKMFRDGFPIRGSNELLPVSLTLIDAGWMTWDIQKIADQDDFWMPSKGFGAGMLKSRAYRAPRHITDSCRIIGQGFYAATVQDRMLIELDGSRWKSSLHQMLRQDIGSVNGLTIAKADDRRLREYIAHLTSEAEIEQYIGGELTSTFADPTGPNHWLDSSYMAIAAKHVDDELSELLSAQVQQPEEIEWSPVVAGSRGGIFG